MEVEQRPFGVTRGHARQGPTRVDEHIVHGGGVTVRCLTYGAHVRAVEVPDAAGDPAVVVLGFDDLAAYEDRARNPYAGALVGRWANRIGDARFVLDGVEHRLTRNHPPHHMHGGEIGFDRYVWTAEPFEHGGRVGVRFTHASPDGDEGYPGTLVATVEYSLSRDGVLRLEYTATTDAPTVVGLTNHGYWNLAGAGTGPVDEHVLALASSRCLPTDATAFPTGEILDVAGTRFDRREPAVVGDAVFDHCFLVDGEPGVLRPAATLAHRASGRRMEVWTDQPGVQCYTGDHFPVTTGADGAADGPRAGLCLETGRPPDAPNRPSFGPSVLRPGETYRSVTEHRFAW